MSNSARLARLDASAAAARAASRRRAPINMNQLGRRADRAGEPPVEALFVYNCNPLATDPEPGAGARRAWRATTCSPSSSTQVWTDTARSPTSCCRRPRSSSTTSWRAATAPCVLHGSRAGRRAGGRGAAEQRRSSASCSGAWAWRAPAIPRTDDELDRRAARQRARRAAAARGARRATASPSPAFGATPVQFVDVFPRTPDAQDPPRPRGARPRGADGLYGYQPDPATAAAPLALISPASAAPISSTFGQLRAARRCRSSSRPTTRPPRGIADGDRVRVWNDARRGSLSAPRSTPTCGRASRAAQGAVAPHTPTTAPPRTRSCPDTLTDLGGGACFNDARVEVQRLD